MGDLSQGYKSCIGKYGRVRAKQNEAVEKARETQ